MKRIYIIIFIACFSSVIYAQSKELAYKTAQLKHQKVKEAYDTKWESLKMELQASNINSSDFDIYIRVFKADKLAEVWMRTKGEVKYRLFKSYDICANSGELGPKRSDDDNQVPEGFYKIETLNPKSNYHLSMKINYPNSSDLILKKGLNPGSAVMLNGDCAAIDGLSMSNDKIAELYLLCLEARSRNKPVNIDIYPVKFSAENMKMLEENYPKSQLSFWKDLKRVYDYFEENKWLPSIFVNRKGHYVLSHDDETIITQSESQTKHDKH